MRKGTLVGEGMTAEVYKWGKDRVIKLFFDRLNSERVKYEAEIGTKVHDSGVPSPAVYGVIDIDGRKGIVFERIFGKTMLKHIEEEPWKLYYFAEKLAGLHFKIHQYSSDTLPSQNERLAFNIGRSSQRLGEKEKMIVDYLKSLPDGVSVCHGDVHFNNVIVSGDELVAIDWNSAYKGNPLGDVARTYLMMTSPGVPQNNPLLTPALVYYINMLSKYSKQLICQTYLNEYMRLAKVSFEDIDAWILPVAAAKLKDMVPGEDKWLMNIINKRLEHLDAKLL